MNDRLPGVDVLRALAAMLVTVHHIHIRFRIDGYLVEPFLPKILRPLLLDTGYYAVICFFVISGFLITRLSLRRWGLLDRLSPAAFYGLRAARILPCLLLVLAVLSVLHLMDVRPFVIRPERGTLGGALIAALGFHVNWYEGVHGYLPGNWDVMWSLSIEETFYLLFPLACLLLRSPIALFCGLLPLIVVGPLNRIWLNDTPPPWDNYAYLCCMDGIAIGCIAGWISERYSLDLTRARIAMAVGAIAVAFILCFRQTSYALGLGSTGTNVTVLEIGMALVLIAMARRVGDRLFTRGTGLLRVIGRASYEIYLTHMFVVFGFFMIFRALFGAQGPSQALYPVCYVIMLVLSVLLGCAVSRWFSEPANRALRAWRLDARARVPKGAEA